MFTGEAQAWKCFKTQYVKKKWKYRGEASTTITRVTANCCLYTDCCVALMLRELVHFCCMTAQKLAHWCLSKQLFIITSYTVYKEVKSKGLNWIKKEDSSMFLGSIFWSLMVTYLFESNSSLEFGRLGLLAWQDYVMSMGEQVEYQQLHNWNDKRKTCVFCEI